MHFNLVSHERPDSNLTCDMIVKNAPLGARTNGQMHPPERQLIYDTVRARKPNLVAECGTWKGGGSTLAIAKALHENQHGKLLSFETNPGFHDEAVKRFRAERPELMPYVSFYLCDFIAGLRPFLPNMVVLDGPEDANYTLRSFWACQSATCMILHDWKNSKCDSVKKALENPSVLHAASWRIDTVLDTETGMARIIR